MYASFFIVNMHEKSKMAQNSSKTKTGKGNYEKNGKDKGRNEKKPCAIYHDAIRVDGAHGIFVGELPSENRKRSLF